MKDKLINVTFPFVWISLAVYVIIHIHDIYIRDEQTYTTYIVFFLMIMIIIMEVTKLFKVLTK